MTWPAWVGPSCRICSGVTRATAASTFSKLAGGKAAPLAVRILKPLSLGGLWLAVIITAPAAPTPAMLNAATGVGQGRSTRNAGMPLAPRTSAVVRANPGDPKRRS